MFFIVKGKANANQDFNELFTRLALKLGNFTKILIGWFKLALFKLLSEKFTLVSLLRFRYHVCYSTCLLSYSYEYGFKK